MAACAYVREKAGVRVMRALAALRQRRSATCNQRISISDWHRMERTLWRWRPAGSDCPKDVFVIIKSNHTSGLTLRFKINPINTPRINPAPPPPPTPLQWKCCEVPAKRAIGQSSGSIQTNNAPPGTGTRHSGTLSDALYGGVRGVPGCSGCQPRERTLEQQ